MDFSELAPTVQAILLRHEPQLTDGARIVATPKKLRIRLASNT